MYPPVIHQNLCEASEAHQLRPLPKSPCKVTEAQSKFLWLEAASIRLLQQPCHLFVEVLSPALVTLQEFPSTEVPLFVLFLQSIDGFLLGQFPCQALAKDLVVDLLEERLPAFQDGDFLCNPFQLL